jgi:hypothetical protein
MKKIVIAVLILIALQMHAQTGIGTTTPNASAKLDVYSTNKGFLPPRVTLASVSDATTITSPAEGLLVYNLGSSGLQSGYYYWNGANWATIATASSAGNGVTAMDMVKLYGEAYSTATGKIANSNGYSFTVPVSGRYQFDFTSTGYANSADFTMTFKVRQGTTDLGIDAQTSASNTVHVEYNGKVEVNLQAGTNYNVIVTSTGLRNSSDFDRVYYKMVAGNLPVTGQTVEYGIARYTGADTGSLANGSIVTFDAVTAGNVPWSSNRFTLKANKTYELESSLAIYLSGGGVGGRFQIYDYTNSVALANGLFMSQNGAGTNNPSANSPMKGVVTPATDIQVGIRLLDWYGPAGPGIIGSTSFTGSQSSPNASYFMVKQVGSSAIINPWTLSGTNTYNTTGNVGIGNNAPTQALDVTGNVNVTGKINLTDPTGNVTTKVAGFVDAGTYVTLDNVRATVNTSGSRGLGLATVTGSFSAFINGTYTVYTGGTNGSGASVSITTTSATSSVFGWNFQGQGDTSTYIVNDTTNRRIYRITLMIGGGYLSNLITIERFL